MPQGDASRFIDYVSSEGRVVDLADVVTADADGKRVVLSVDSVTGLSRQVEVSDPALQHRDKFGAVAAGVKRFIDATSVENRIFCTDFVFGDDGGTVKLRVWNTADGKEIESKTERLQLRRTADLLRPRR